MMFMRSNMPAAHRRQVVEYIDKNWSLFHQGEHYRSEVDRTENAMTRLRTEFKAAQVALHKAKIKARIAEEKVSRLAEELDCTESAHAYASVKLDRLLHQIKQEDDALKVA